MSDLVTNLRFFKSQINHNNNNTVCFQPYNVLAHPIKQAKAAGLKIENKVMDVSNVDVSI